MIIILKLMPSILFYILHEACLYYMLTAKLYIRCILSLAVLFLIKLQCKLSLHVPRRILLLQINVYDLSGFRTCSSRICKCILHVPCVLYS